MSAFAASQTADSLTKREIELLRLMVADCSIKEMAVSLHKPGGTIKNQTSNILPELGARDRTRAVLKTSETSII